MRCAQGSINQILLEWDPGPTYLVQRLWDPGGPSYSSRSHVPTNLDRLGKLEKLPRLYRPTRTIIPSHPSHPNVKSSTQTPPREARPYLPRVDQLVYRDCHDT